MPQLKIKIDTVQPWAGESVLDMAGPLKGMEWRIVERISGVTIGEFDAELARVKWDLYVALTVVALIREGKIAQKDMLECADVLLELVPMEELVIEAVETAADAEADAGPPAKPPASASGGKPSRPASPPPIGPPGSNGGGEAEQIPSPIGSPG